MKHVYDTDEIAHLWMHQTQEDARNPGGNFYFSGDTIYSYGSHFPIARHVVNAAGERAILFTTCGYGVTTSKHIRLVRDAIHGNDRKVLYLQSITGSVTQAIAELHEQITSAERACFGSTGRFKPTAWRALADLIGQANAYCEFFASARRWVLPENAEAIKTQIKADDERRAKEHKRLERKYKIEQKARAKKMAEDLDLWRNGEAIATYRFDYDTPVALRLKDGEVQTSKGAVVPVEHARRLLAIVRKVKDSGQGYQRNGHTIHVGEFAVDSISADGTLKAGCHVIAWEEIARFAPQLEA